jgi:hypothetical protein
MKPIKTSPVRAITAFFPIEERAQLQVGVDMDLGAMDIQGDYPGLSHPCFGSKHEVLAARLSLERGRDA